MKFFDMPTFAELVDTVYNLSKEEMEEMRRILDKKLISLKEQEILDAIEEAKRDKEEGKTIVLSTPEEIKGYFEKILENGD